MTPTGAEGLKALPNAQGRPQATLNPLAGVILTYCRAWGMLASAFAKPI